jgi:hypothetical protein
VHTQYYSIIPTSLQVILAANSDYLNKILYETSKQGNTNICFPRLDPNAFKTILQFMYTGELDCNNNVPFATVERMAKYLNISNFPENQKQSTKIIETPEPVNPTQSTSAHPVTSTQTVDLKKDTTCDVEKTGDISEGSGLDSNESDQSLFRDSSTQEPPLAKKIRTDRDKEDYNKTEDINNMRVEPGSKTFEKIYTCLKCDFKTDARQMAVSHSKLLHDD